MQSRIWAGIASSLAVSGVLALFAFSVVRGIGDDLARGRYYSEVINKTYALNLLVATFGEESNQRHIQQFGEVRSSLTKLLRDLSSSDVREESLIRQIQRNNQELGPLLDQYFAPRTPQNDCLQTELKNMLAAQLCTKVRFITDDTARLMEISESRVVSTHAQAGITVLLLLITLMVANVIISLVSSRSIVRMQEVLRKQREWLQVTLSSIGDAVIATDTESRIAFLNPVASALTGWPIEEALGRPVEDLLRIINEKTREPAEDIISRVLRDGGNVALANHTALVARDGREIPIEDCASPIRDGTGKVAGVVLVFHDVTEKRRAREALRESEAKLRAVLDQMPSGVTVRDARTGELILSNARSLEIMGALVDTPEQFARYRGFHPDGRLYRTEEWPVCRSMATGEIVEAEEIECERSDGSRITLSISSAPVLDSQGRIAIGVGVFHDITERKRTEQELRKSRDELELRVHERTAELERSNQALQDFAAIASHDLQEPLRKVSTFGNMLKQKSGDSLGQQENDYLDRILVATQRMQSLLTALLEYSRLTTRAAPFVDVELTRTVQEVLSDLEVRIESTGGEVLVGELPVIQADPTQMRQLFQNLIGNALKFHKEDERPIVKVSSTAVDERTFRIVVEDNGIGFDEQYLEKIFAPFQRLHGRSSHFEGTGMGLAICKKIVERHCGSITARSRPGAGSTFTITLPTTSSGGQK